MTTIEDLPPEIINHISARLTPHDRSQLLATCQHLHITISAQLWRNVELKARQVGASKSQSRMSVSTWPREPYLSRHCDDPLGLRELRTTKRRKMLLNSNKRFGAFCRAVRAGVYDSVLCWVENLVLEVSLDADVFSTTDLGNDKVKWFLFQALGKFTNLRKLMITVWLTPAVKSLQETMFNRMLDQAPNSAKIHVEIAPYNSNQQIGFEKVDAANNIEFLRVCPAPEKGFVCTQFVTKLPQFVKRVDLWSHTAAEYKSHELAGLFEHCQQLEVLSLCNVNLSDCKVQWIPKSVKELSLQQTAATSDLYIPPHVVSSVTFVHVFAEYATLDESKFEQINHNFPSISGLFIEKARIEHDFLHYLLQLMPRLTFFGFMSAVGYYFEEYDLFHFLSNGKQLNALMMGHCHFSSTDYVENIKVDKKLSRIQLRPSVGYDDNSKALLVRAIEAMTNLTSTLQVDMYHYRWQDIGLNMEELMTRINSTELVASRGENGHYLFDVDYQKVWNRSSSRSSEPAEIQ